MIIDTVLWITTAAVVASQQGDFSILLQNSRKSDNISEYLIYLVQTLLPSSLFDINNTF